MAILDYSGARHSPLVQVHSLLLLLLYLNNFIIINIYYI